MRGALLILLVAGTSLAADRVQRTRDAHVPHPPATASVRPSRAAPAVQPLNLQPLNLPATSFVGPSLSVLAPALEPMEATQTVDAEPFAVHGENRVTLKVEHQFTRADARERVTQLLDYWARRFGVKSEWRGYRVYLTGRVLGIDIQALFDVTDHNVLALASDPGTVLRGSAESYVDKKLRKYLSPTYDEP